MLAAIQHDASPSFVYIPVPTERYWEALALLQRFVTTASTTTEPPSANEDNDIYVAGSGVWTREVIEMLAREPREDAANLVLRTLAERANEYIARSELEALSGMTRGRLDSVFNWLGKKGNALRTQHEIPRGPRHQMPLQIGEVDGVTAWMMPPLVARWWLGAAPVPAG